MALFDNWDFMKQNLEWAYTAEGTLDEQASIYAESWEAAANRVSAAAEAIYTDLIKDDAFISLLNVVEDVLTVIDKLIDSMGGLPGVIALAGTAITKVFNKQIASGITNTIYMMKDLKASAYNMGLNAAKGLKIKSAEGKDPMPLQAEIVRAQAAEEISEMGSQLAMSGQGTAALAYSKIGELQQIFLENNDKLTDQERLINQQYIERAQAQAGILMDMQEEVSLVSDNINQSKGYVAINEKIKSLKGKEHKEEKEELLTIQHEIDKYKQLLKVISEIVQLESVRDATDDSSAQQKVQAQLDQKTKELNSFFGRTEDDDDWYSSSTLKSSKLIEDLRKQEIKVGNLTEGALQKGLISSKTEQSISEELALGTNKLEAFSQASDKFEACIKSVGDAMDQAKNRARTFGENVAQITPAISSLTMVVFSATNAWNTLTTAMDDGHVSMQEVLSVITSISTALPMLISGFNQLQKSEWIQNGAEKLKSTSFDYIKDTITGTQDSYKPYEDAKSIIGEYYKTNNAKIKAGDKDTIQNKYGIDVSTMSQEDAMQTISKNLTSNMTALDKYKVILNDITAGTQKATAAQKAQAAVTAVLGKGITSLVTKMAPWLLLGTAVIAAIKIGVNIYNKAADELEDAKKRTEEATETFENAKNAYNELKSTIADYNDQKEAISELTKGTTEWYEAIQKANESALSLLDTFPELVNEITTNEDGLLEFSEEAQEKILKSQLATYKNAQRNLYNAQINENEKQAANDKVEWSRSVDTFTSNAYERQALNTLLERYQKEGNAANLFNADTLVKEFGFSEASAQRLLDSGIKELIVALDNNTKSNELYEEQRASSALSQHLSGYEDSAYKESLNAFQAAESDTYAIELEARREVNSYKKKEKKQMYADAMGMDLDEVEEAIDNDELDMDDITEFLQEEAQQMFAMSATAEFGNTIQAFEDSLTGVFNANELGANAFSMVTEGLAKAISDGDPEVALADYFNSLNEEELAALIESGDSVESAVSQFYENNASYFEKLGIKDAETFLAAYNTALQNRQESGQDEDAALTRQQQWKDSLSDLATELDMDEDAIEGYAETLRSLYPDLADNDEATLAAVERNVAFAHGFDDLVTALEDYEDVLADTNDASLLSAEALAEVGNAMESMLGVHVSNNFIKEYLQEIKELAEGDMSALEELQVAAAKDYIASFTIPDEDKSQIYSFIDEINGMDLELGVESKIDEDGFINQMNALIEAGKITADEVNEALGAIGYHADVKTQTIDGPTTTYDMDLTGSGVLGQFLQMHVSGTNTSQVEVPVLNGKITRTSTPSSLGSSVSKTQHKKDDSGGDKEEMQRYYTISNQLETLGNQYERIAALKEQAYGADKLKYIDQEIEKQEELIDAQKEYIRQIKSNLLLDQSRMNSYGAKYDENGNITNYRTLFKKYGQDETFQKYLEQYQETLHLLETAQNDLEQKEIELKSANYEAIISKIDYKMEENAKTVEVLDKMYSYLEDDVYKVAEAFQVLMTGIDGSTNRVELLKSDMSMLQQQYADLAAAWAQGSLNEADYIEGLNNTLDGLLDSVDAYEELIDTTKEYYGETLEKAQDELAHYTDQLDNAVKKLEHFQKVQELSGQGTDYETTLKILSAQKSVTKNSYDVAKQWYEARKADQEALEASLAQINKEENSVLYEIEEQKLRDAMAATQEAYNTMAEHREEYLELAQEEYKTTIDSIAAYASETLAGDKFLNLDSLLDSMQNVSTYADEYLTKTNQLYETNKLLRQVNADMDKTSNKAAKQRLSNFTQEIEAAQQQTELSNLELEILQAKYKQLQAQIALEEAQNAKSTVRLSRDNEGNYGYIYTADKDNIADAEQALDDADNDLYNIRLKAFNNYSEKKIQAEKELNDKIKEIWEDETLSYEEKEAEIQRITEEHYAIIDAYTDLATIAQQEDARIQADAWAAAYSQQSLDAINWKNTVEDSINKAKTAAKQYHEDIDPMVKDTKEGYDTLADAVDNVTKESEELTTVLTKKGGVLDSLNDNIEEVDKLTKSWGNSLNGMKNFVTEIKTNLIPAIQSAIANVQSLITAQEKLNSTKSIGDVTGSGSGSGTTGSDLPQKTTTSQKETSTGPWYVIVKEPNGSSAKTTYSTQEEAKAFAYKMKDINSNCEGKVTCKSSDQTYEVTYTQKSLQYSVKVGSTTYTADSLSKLKEKVRESKTYKTWTDSNFNRKWQTLSQSVYTHYDTGGYTGDWGDKSGRLAVLHQKELVLNAEDTKNFLAGINVVRDISKQIDLQAFYQNSSTYTSSIKPNSSNSTLQQEVMIKAEFPNATNHTEIEQAFDTLINRAAQYANRRD